MKRYNLTAAATALAVLALFAAANFTWGASPVKDVIKVGFLYENDESTPYTYNFALAQRALENQYPDRVETIVKSNVLATETEEPLREMARKGCAVIFTNTDSNQVMQAAKDFPAVQFCQESYADLSTADAPENYHTFNGKIYQGRYVSGIAAGMKLKEMLDAGEITADQALVGFVSSYPTAEAISGYTAFLLGVRSVAKDARMLVKYSHTGSSYSQEKACAKELIDMGCIVISQHTHTIGPAVACEEASESRKVFHVGYNQSMLDVAPTTALISTRVNWTPYVVQAVEAVLAGKRIEQAVDGDVRGNDVGAGFEKGWVEMLDLNTLIAAEGTQEQVNRAIAAFKKGSLDVFRGDYIGVDPENSTDVYDLSAGYMENQQSSAPTFHYVLRDVIAIVR